MFMFMMCFQCVDGFILLYTVHTCNNVSCAPTQPRADSELPARSHLWNAGLSSWCCPWCSTLTVSLRVLWLWAKAAFFCFFFPFIAALALQKRGASAPRHIAVLAFFFFIFFFKKWSRRTFVRLPLSETTSRQEIFRDLNVTSATSTVILLFMRPPGISADALPLPTRTVGEVS